MKKTLIAAAALSAMAASAMAADVTVYGQVGTALQFQQTKVTQSYKALGTTEGTARKVTMESGIPGGERFGLKASEDLGNIKVAAVLESGISTDSGSYSGALFNRESSVAVSGSYGSVKFGRFGNINGSANGGVITAGMGYTTSYNLAGAEAVMSLYSSRWNNMVQYQTPVFAGFQGTVQYSLGESTDAGNAHNSTNLLAAAVTYKAGDFAAGVGVDQVDRAYRQDNNQEKMRTIQGFVNYNFGAVKAYLGAQYAQHMDRLPSYKLIANGKYGSSSYAAQGSVPTPAFTDTFTVVRPFDYNTLSLTLGASGKAFGGDLFGQLGYFKATDKAVATYTAATVSNLTGKPVAKKSVSFDTDNDVKGFQIGLGYKYSLSKRTFLFGNAGYLEGKFDRTGKTKVIIADVGVKHSF